MVIRMVRSPARFETGAGGPEDAPLDRLEAVRNRIDSLHNICAMPIRCVHSWCESSCASIVYD